MAYQEPERMRFHILAMFGGVDPSLSLAYATAAERARYAKHWWEREALRGREGDFGFIMDIYPDGSIRFKSIKQCYQDGVWETVCAK